MDEVQGDEPPSGAVFKETQTHCVCPTASPLHLTFTSTDDMISWCTSNHHVSSSRGATVRAEQQERRCEFLPLGLIYRPVLGCYSTDLLPRPGVNCPTLGSISNRTARDMGPDTSKCCYYIIACCFGKWSLHTPPFTVLPSSRTRKLGSQASNSPRVSSPQNPPWWSPAHPSWRTPHLHRASLRGPESVKSLSSYFSSD